MKLSKIQSLLVASSALLLAAAFFQSDPFLLWGEQIPAVFALALTMLAVGLLGKQRTVAAGVVAGLALLYDVRVAIPFWLLTFLALWRDRFSRTLGKPLAWSFLVFTLLLGNLAQLQLVPSRSESAWTRIPPNVASIDRDRLPWQWIGAWSGLDVLLFVVLVVLAFCSLVTVWRRVNGLLRTYLLGLPLIGFISVPLTLVLVDLGRFTLFVRAALPGWLALDASCLLLLGTTTLLIKVPMRSSNTPMLLIACLSLLCLAGRFWQGEAEGSMAGNREISDLARWAEANTWAGSMFLFPDCGQAVYPSTFRASAQRALWVDWASGLQVNSSETLADEWQRRWDDTMARPWDTNRLQSMLGLPIDYYVLQKRNQLAGITPNFATAHLVVYDADVLRSVYSAPRRLHEHG